MVKGFAKGAPLHSALLVALAAAALVGVALELLAPNDLAAYDALNRNWDRSDEQHPDLVLLDLETRTGHRAEIAAVLERLVDLPERPRAIGLDIVLDEPANHPVDDDRLEAAIRRVVEKGIPIFVGAGIAHYGPDRPHELLPPLERFVKAGARYGVVNMFHDRFGNVREVAAFVMDGDRRVHGLPALLAGELQSPLKNATDGRALTLGGDREVPLLLGFPAPELEGARHRIDFAAGPDVLKSIRYSALADNLDKLETQRLLLSSLGEEGAKVYEIKRTAVVGGFIQDRVMLLGHGSPERNPDLAYVPALDEAPFTPGVAVLGQAVRSLVKGRTIDVPSRPVRLLLTLGVAILTALLVVQLRSPLLAMLAALLGIAVAALISGWLFFETGTCLPIYHLAVAPVAVVGLDLWRRLRSQRRGLLTYLSEAAADPLASESTATTLGAAVPFPVANLWADLRSFPPNHERMQRLIDLAEAIIKLLALAAVSEARRLGMPPELRRYLEAHLPRPSLGHFASLLRQAAGWLGERADQTIAPRLWLSYLSNNQMDRTISRLVEVRNQLRGHGVLLPASEYRALMPAVEADVERLLKRMAPLEESPLFEVKATKRTEAGLVAEGQLLMGPGETHPHAELAVDETHREGALILVSREHGRSVALDPLLSSMPCEYHKDREIAFVNGLTRSGAPRYLSYQKGCTSKRLRPPKGAKAMLKTLLQGAAAALLIALTAGFAVADEPAPLAVVVLVDGDVTLERPGKKAEPLKDLAILYSGDVLAPKDRSMTMIIDRAGKTRTIKARTELDEKKEPSRSEAFFAALVEKVKGIDKGRVGVEAARRPRGGIPNPISPRTRQLDGRPLFTWHTPEAGTHCLLRLEREQDDGSRELVLEQKVSGGRWAWPTHEAALTPGFYAYTLESLPPEGTEAQKPPEERRSEEIVFLVMDEAFRQQIAAELAHRHLLMATLYERDGVMLLDDARRELLEGLRLAPDHKALQVMLKDIEERIEAMSGVRLPEGAGRR